MTRLHRFFGVLITSGAVGFGYACGAGDTATPVLLDHDVQGSWSERGLFPGSGFEIALTETAGVVTGTGRFAVEAGTGGTLAASGSVRNDSLHLQVVFVSDAPGLLPDSTSFVGALVARDTIDGTLTDRVSGPQRIQLVRQ